MERPKPLSRFKKIALTLVGGAAAVGGAGGAGFGLADLNGNLDPMADVTSTPHSIVEKLNKQKSFPYIKGTIDVGYFGTAPYDPLYANDYIGTGPNYDATDKHLVSINGQPVDFPIKLRNARVYAKPDPRYSIYSGNGGSSDSGAGWVVFEGTFKSDLTGATHSSYLFAPYDESNSNIDTHQYGYTTSDAHNIKIDQVVPETSSAPHVNPKLEVLLHQDYHPYPQKEEGLFSGSIAVVPGDIHLRIHPDTKGKPVPWEYINSIYGQDIKGAKKLIFNDAEIVTGEPIKYYTKVVYDNAGDTSTDLVTNNYWVKITVNNGITLYFSTELNTNKDFGYFNGADDLMFDGVNRIYKDGKVPTGGSTLSLSPSVEVVK